MIMLSYTICDMLALTCRGSRFWMYLEHKRSSTSSWSA